MSTEDIIGDLEYCYQFMDQMDQETLELYIRRGSQWLEHSKLTPDERERLLKLQREVEDKFFERIMKKPWWQFWKRPSKRQRERWRKLL